MIRRSLTALALAGLLAIPAARAMAAPSNAPYSDTFPVQCGQASFVVTVNSGQSGDHGNGQANAYSPAFIVSGGSGLAILQMISGSFYDPYGNLLGSFSQSKGNSQANGLPKQTCTFVQYDQYGDQFDGTVTVAINSHANTAH
jgi:hypothetical protein